MDTLFANADRSLRDQPSKRSQSHRMSSSETLCSRPSRKCVISVTRSSTSCLRFIGDCAIVRLCELSHRI